MTDLSPAAAAAQHPITPPPELLHQWATEYWGNPGESIGEGEKYIATQAARWGADQELEACCEWLDDTDCDDPQEVAQLLRAARRPAPTLKEQALAALKRQKVGSLHSLIAAKDCDIIRRALEQIDD